ncbi:hypothetical protein K2173_020866 [Erythroxylum novogranatense]|uniref:Very-long-chain 3-oxoacyl-CoA synthase n=1 Tax=Erythroxylum novogranatense TaxID=1862640 RepID=A0AAV8TN92_9ROSI|nr:hypothetical protein K2173_020866 [Erythroxylum novogranatense]
MESIFSTIKHLSETNLKSNPFFSKLEYWLVSQPIIHNFSWKQGDNFGSSPFFVFSIIFCYLSLTFLLSRIPLPSTSPRLLRSVKVLHSLLLLSLSGLMALGCCLSVLFYAPTLYYIICLPIKTPPNGPLFFWAYVFYMSKIYEFLDTLLIILSNSKRRLTFLHVYHHATVVIMCYLSLHTSQSMFPAVIVTNASVHVIMYYYYMMCALGSRPSWKKRVTDCQIMQFYSSFGIIPVMFYYHLSGEGCSGIWACCFNAVFIITLLFLFLDFRVENYASNATKDKDT